MRYFNNCNQYDFGNERAKYGDRYFKDVTVGLNWRPRLFPDVISNVSVNTPYPTTPKERKEKMDRYRETHLKFLQSFSDLDKYYTTLSNRYGYTRNIETYIYDGYKFDNPLEMALYIYCVDNNIDLIRLPNTKSVEVIDEITSNRMQICPDFKYGDKYICIRPSHIYEESEDMFYGSLYNFQYTLDFLKESNKLLENNGVEIWNENTPEMKTILDYIYNNYSDYYIPLFYWDLPFPYPNENLEDTSNPGLIAKFHKSIYDANYRCQPSSIEVWNDKEIFKRLALNRLYFVGDCCPRRMRTGLNIAKIAIKVSCFKPSLAERLIKKYLNEFSEIRDIFSGFSGRMLGAISCGKRYIGSDINETHVRESNEILDWLRANGDYRKREAANKASVIVGDALTLSGEYECLLTCPPYEDIEDWGNPNQAVLTCDEWIDVCIRNFKCKRYVFVVDDKLEKYLPYVINDISNKGHMGHNQELIVVIDRDENGIKPYNKDIAIL